MYTHVHFHRQRARCRRYTVGIVVAVIAALATQVTPAHAQQQDDGWRHGRDGHDGAGGMRRAGPELSIGVGPVWPVGTNTLNTESNTGLAYDGALAIPIAPHVSVRVRYECSTFRRESATRPTGLASGVPGETHLSAGTGDLVFGLAPLGSSIIPYLFTGVGVAEWKRDTVTVAANRLGLTDAYGTETAFAWDGGGGIKVPVSPVAALFAEASYYLTFTRDTRTPIVPLRVGMALGRTR